MGRKLPEETKKEIARVHKETGENMNVLATKFNTSISTVMRSIKKYNGERGSFTKFVPVSESKIDIAYNGITISIPLSQLKQVLEVLK